MLSTTTKFAVTAILSLVTGAAGTYATMHVAVTCISPAVSEQHNYAVQPETRDLPLTGWQRY